MFVEWWRPETSTFHLLVDELTVTLEDVCCLWGLSIKDILNFLCVIFFEV
jgi:Plant mobile domain